MVHLLFNEYGISNSLRGNGYIEKIEVKKNRPYIFPVDRHSIGCATHYKIIRCDYRAVCTDEYENLLVSQLCLPRFNDKGSVSLIFYDNDNIGKFTIFEGKEVNGMGENITDEIFSFKGGTIDALEDTLNEYGVEFTLTEYGVELYLKKYYIGKELGVDSSDVFLGGKVCSNVSSVIPLDLCFKDEGCYRIVLSKNGEDLATSGNISVVGHDPYGTYCRYKYKGLSLIGELPFSISGMDTVLEEEETELNGIRTITSSIIKSNANIFVHHASNRGHSDLIMILNSGISIKSEEISGDFVLNGTYSKADSYSLYEYSATATLENVSEMKYQGIDCGKVSCDTGATIRVDILDYARTNMELNKIV